MAEKDRKDGIEVIEKAIMFATQAHEGQVRKGTDRPYIVHPLEVGRIVASMTEDEEIISAAVLHDTIEDCAGVSRELLAEEFSERVAGIVAQESEDKSKTWMERNDRAYSYRTQRSADGRTCRQAFEYEGY